MKSCVPAPVLHSPLNVDALDFNHLSIPFSTFPCANMFYIWHVFQALRSVFYRLGQI